MAGISSNPRYLFTPFRPSAGSHSPPPATGLPLLNRIPNPSRLRFRYQPRSSPAPRQNPNSPDDKPSNSIPLLRPTDSSSSSIIASAISRIRIDEISLEILYIALPAVLALAADPLASLVDTAFVGHLGSAELAAVGVSASVFNLVSKLFNVPLLNITTSFVAEQQALMSGIGSSEKIVQTKEDFGSSAVGEPVVAANAESRKYIPAVPTSLVLAAGIGIMETIALSVGSGLLMNIMGFTSEITS